MSQRKNGMRTFIQGDISPKQQQSVQTHMDNLGFGYVDSETYSYESSRHWEYITATEDVLGSISKLPMHSHTFMEIFRYTSDSRVEYLIGTHRYFLQKGDIICIPPGTFHQVLRYEPEDTPCVRDLIALSPSFLESVGWSNEPDQYYLLRATQKEREDWAVLCALCVREQREKAPRWRDAMEGAVRILLAQIVRNADRSIEAEQEGLFEQILSYIDENLGQKITLAETALHFFSSERTITREFRKNLGISFHGYVTQRKLLMASNLIAMDIPLEEVCQRVGYGDYATFYRAFKKEFGISPRQMKQGN